VQTMRQPRTAVAVDPIATLLVCRQARVLTKPHNCRRTCHSMPPVFGQAATAVRTWFSSLIAFRPLPFNPLLTP
jgi:hypothetical protein